VSARSRRPGERGAALIEFVLVAPLFLLLMLGAIDWGWYFVVRETLVNATREGARAASVQDDPPTQSQAAAIAAVRAYLTNVGVSAMPVQSPDVTFTTIVVPGVATPVSAVSVQITSYPSPAISGLTMTLVPATITAQTVMRLEVTAPPPPPPCGP
jgi:Flp pilus assembly protein TadG